ncbi:MAG: hypothetical protein R3A13_03730 [Bdellovibrionota bacterium]
MHFFIAMHLCEANHDTEMLETCHYPWELKQRIASAYGHLSNASAAELLTEIYHDEMFHLVLAHLSENSNTPELARNTVAEQIDLNFFHSFECGSPFQPTDLIRVGEVLPALAVG